MTNLYQTFNFARFFFGFFKTNLLIDVVLASCLLSFKIKNRLKLLI